jgi:hypothetical protein
MTFFHKYIFTVTWIVGFGVGTLSMFISNSNNAMFKIIVLFAWIFGTIFTYLFSGRIKKVEFDGYNFYVSNYLRSETINVSNVKSVSGYTLLKPELVCFELKENTSFGKTIIFMPKIRFYTGLSPNPIVNELKQKCGL